MRTASGHPGVPLVPALGHRFRGVSREVMFYYGIPRKIITRSNTINNLGTHAAKRDLGEAECPSGSQCAKSGGGSNDWIFHFIDRL